MEETKVCIYIWKGNREYAHKTINTDCCTIEFCIHPSDTVMKDRIIKDHIKYAFNTFDGISKITIEEQKVINKASSISTVFSCKFIFIIPK